MLFFALGALAAELLGQGLEAVFLRPQATWAALSGCHWSGHDRKPGVFAPCPLPLGFTQTHS